MLHCYSLPEFTDSVDSMYIIKVLILVVCLTGDVPQAAVLAGVPLPNYANFYLSVPYDFLRTSNVLTCHRNS